MTRITATAESIRKFQSSCAIFVVDIYNELAFNGDKPVEIILSYAEKIGDLIEEHFNYAADVRDFYTNWLDLPYRDLPQGTGVPYLEFMKLFRESVCPVKIVNKILDLMENGEDTE